MSERGFVVSGGLSLQEIARTAAQAEVHGYSTFWITVLAGQTDPVAALSAALSATDAIEVGLGLVPLSAFGGAETGRAVAGLTLGSRRIVVGLGVGSCPRRACEFWAQEAAAFKRAAPLVPIAVGSYGPRVLRAGGRLADTVLLNWMTPERIQWAVARVDAGARAANRPPPRPVYVYVAAAVGADGAARIEAALNSMTRYPYHRRHQEAMRASEPVGVVARNRSEAAAGLSRYAGAVPVVNAVVDSDAAGRLEVLRRFAPHAGPNRATGHGRHV